MQAIQAIARPLGIKHESGKPVKTFTGPRKPVYANIGGNVVHVGWTKQ